MPAQVENDVRPPQLSFTQDSECRLNAVQQGAGSVTFPPRLSYASTMIEHRKHVRYRIDWRGTCTSRSGLAIDVKILDCSDGSFGVSGLHNYSPEESLMLQIDGIGTFPCQIVWVKGERFGVRIVDTWGEGEFSSLTDYLGQA